VEASLHFPFFIFFVPVFAIQKIVGKWKIWCVWSHGVEQWDVYAQKQGSYVTQKLLVTSQEATLVKGEELPRPQLV
jgi:hypothetical protein